MKPVVPLWVPAVALAWVSVVESASGFVIPPIDWTAPVATWATVYWLMSPMLLANVTRTHFPVVSNVCSSAAVALCAAVVTFVARYPASLKLLAVNPTLLTVWLKQ